METPTHHSLEIKSCMKNSQYNLSVSGHAPALIDMVARGMPVHPGINVTILQEAIRGTFRKPLDDTGSHIHVEDGDFVSITHISKYPDDTGNLVLRETVRDFLLQKNWKLIKVKESSSRGSVVVIEKWAGTIEGDELHVSYKN